MARYHINPTTGNPGLCRAQHQCPFGGDEHHWPSAEEASRASEKPAFSVLRDVDDYCRESRRWLSTLTLDEKSALEEYVNQGYSSINQQLWQGVEAHSLIPFLDSALLKAPRAPQILYRKPAVPELDNRFEFQEFTDSLIPGSEVRLPGYTSTSEALEGVMPLLVDKPTGGAFVSQQTLAELDQTWRNVVFKMRAPRAAPAGAFSHMPQEREWLLPRNMNFRVTSVEYGKLLVTQRDILNRPCSQQKIATLITLDQLD